MKWGGGVARLLRNFRDVRNFTVKYVIIITNTKTEPFVRTRPSRSTHRLTLSIQHYTSDHCYCCDQGRSFTGCGEYAMLCGSGFCAAGTEHVKGCVVTMPRSFLGYMRDGRASGRLSPSRLDCRLGSRTAVIGLHHAGMIS